MDTREFYRWEDLKSSVGIHKIYPIVNGDSLYDLETFDDIRIRVVIFNDVIYVLDIQNMCSPGTSHPTILKYLKKIVFFSLLNNMSVFYFSPFKQDDYINFDFVTHKDYEIHYDYDSRRDRYVFSLIHKDYYLD